jgi:membrane fusion protein, multidrug efflux system
MSKFATILAIFLILSMFGGCSRAPAPKPAPPPMKVGVTSVDQGDIRQTLEVSGNLNFIANTTVSAEVSAQIASLEVADGQRVEQGQILLVFDDTKIKESANQAQATLQKDEATLAFNKTDWEKNVELHRTGAISQTTYEQKLSAYQNSLAQVEADKAALAKAMVDLQKTKVVSPVTGIVSNRYVEKGDCASEGGKLFQISEYNKVYLEAFVSDVDVGKLNIGKIITKGVDAEVAVDSYRGDVFPGKLTYVQPVANQARLFQTRIYLENPDMKLLQGMFARAKIVVNVIHGVLRVPLQALLEQNRENDANTVVLVDGQQRAQLNPLKIGLADPQYAEVVDGLKKGDMVVVRGKEILSAGQPLELAEKWEPQTKSVQ